MMWVKYRIVEKLWTVGEGWEPWGVVYENCSGLFPRYRVLLLVSLAESRGTTRDFEARVDDLALGLENIEQMLGEQSDRFRVLPDIQTVEGATHKEIRHRLWRILCDTMQARITEMAEVETSTSVMYTVQPTYHVARETVESSGIDEDGY